MKIGVLGTGIVGETIATKLTTVGHEVCMGSRGAANEKAAAWAEGIGQTHGTFADAASFGSAVFNCTAGSFSLDALAAAGVDNLEGKLIVDVANALDFSNPPLITLSVANSDSLGEHVQRTYPGARVVKALNTMNCKVMVEPSLVPGDHNVLLCGDDADAKHEVVELLESFGWPAWRILDLGDITAARGLEMYAVLWVRLFGSLGTSTFNIAVSR